MKLGFILDPQPPASRRQEAQLRAKSRSTSLIPQWQQSREGLGKREQQARRPWVGSGQHIQGRPGGFQKQGRDMTQFRSFKGLLATGWGRIAGARVGAGEPRGGQHGVQGRAGGAWGQKCGRGGKRQMD